MAESDVFYVAFVDPITGQERIAQFPYRSQADAREYAAFLASIGEAKDCHVRAACPPTGHVLEEFTHIQEDMTYA